MPEQFDFQNAIGNALNRPWQDPQFLQSYGNYGPQFPNQSTQIGAAMYSNIQPQQYTAPWAIQNLPGRLQGPGYLNGGSVGNYGGLFGNRWGNGPRAIGNPYPINGYGLQNMTVLPPWLADSGTMNYNPFLRNQNGNSPWGLPGGAGNPFQQQQPQQMPQQQPQQAPQAPPQQAPQMAPQQPQPPSLEEQSRARMASYAAQAQAAQQQPPLAFPGADKLETAPSTLDPGSMRGLLYFLGGSNPGPQSNDYASWYQQNYGQQAPNAPKAYWP